MATGQGSEASSGLLRDFCADHRADIGAVVMYAAAVGVLVLATPLAVQTLVGTAAFGTVLQPIVVTAVLLLGGLVFAGVLRVLKTYAVEVIQQRMFVRTVGRLAFLLPRTDVTMSREPHAVHRFFDLFTAQKAAATLLLGGVDVVLATLVGVVVLAFYHPLLLVFDVGLLAALAMLVRWGGRGGIESALDESARKLALGAFLADITAPTLAFRDPHGRSFAQARIDALARDYLVARARHFRVVLRQLGGAVALQAVASAVLLGLGGWLVIEREMTLGQLVAAELIVTAVLASLGNLAKYAEVYYDLIASLHKLDGLERAPCEKDGRQSVLESTGPAALTLENVALTRGARRVLDGASCHIDRGARVSFEGCAGSGRSTLFDLLYGLSTHESGRVLLDEVDTRELSREAMRTRVALVRRPALIADTVIENVRMGDPAVSVSAVRALLAELGLLAELDHLPRGLETPLHPQCADVSESQALRITLARAIVRGPGLLLIDADLTSLDESSYARVAAVLTRPGAPWTLLVAEAGRSSHRLGHEVLRLSGGHLVSEVTDDAA